MYTKDKSQRITLRLNETQFEFVKGNADILGVSPSDFLRMVINTTMSISKVAVDKAFDERTGDGRANDKTDIDDLV